MVEQQTTLEPQKNTVWYGIGKFAEKLGPKSWEQHAEKVINDQIIPRVSPEMKQWIEAHKAGIAKAAGWTAVGAETAIVAGTIYGAVKLVGKNYSERHVSGRKVSGETFSMDTKGRLPQGPKIENADAWWDSLQHAGQEEVDITWLKRLSGEISGIPAASLLVSKTQHVGPEDVPEWLSKLASKQRPSKIHQTEPEPEWLRDVLAKRKDIPDPKKAPDFVKRAMAVRAASRASEANVMPPPGHKKQHEWWQQRNIARSQAAKIETPQNKVKPLTDIPDFMIGMYPERPITRAEESTTSPVLNEKLARIQQISAGTPDTVAAHVSSVGTRVKEIKSRRKEVPATNESQPLPSTLSIEEKWAPERAQMQARREMEMNADYEKRSSEALQKARARQAELAAINTESDRVGKDLAEGIYTKLKHDVRTFERGSKIDINLARQNPELVAAIAGRVSKLGTNERSSSKELATLLVQIGEKPDEYRPLLERLQQQRSDTLSHDALVAAADLFRQADKKGKILKKFDPSGARHGDYTTLAAFWVQRLRLAGLPQLLK